MRAWAVEALAHHLPGYLPDSMLVSTKKNEEPLLLSVLETQHILIPGTDPYRHTKINLLKYQKINNAPYD